ncbi:hypothetical protein EXIGLDRAFT_690881 [Exidia glandulosa HHB12029]|uniref:Uncharacterized protein n=1 Tax=Exidia glandulosa HHB12029 TaxID=1314781 RepID=A0A165R057_EXIGL|nr:hypothetical protein EXIGLDRAFT_690881 [Exidia glandulosa HHB12029]
MSSAPFSSMPVEALRSIFEPAIEGDDMFVFALAHVCRSFREAARRSPSLWTTVRVSAGNRHAKALVDVFLARSGILPLVVAISCPSAPTMTETTARKQRILSVVGALRAHQQRLRSLVLTVDNIESAHATINLCIGPAPELVQLVVTVVQTGPGQSEELDGLQHAFQPCPNLRILTLGLCRLPLGLSSVVPRPYATLTTLTLEGVRGRDSDLKAQLEMVPNLRHLACVHWHITVQDAVGNPVILESLETLTVVDKFYGTSGLAIIDSLTTPALVHLSLHALFDGNVECEYATVAIDFADDDMRCKVGEAVVGYLERSGWPSLLTLKLEHCEMLGIDMICILDNAWRLQELYLAGNIRIDVFKHLAGPGEAQGQLCTPYLHTLNVTDVPLLPSWIEDVAYGRRDAAALGRCPELEVNANGCGDIHGWNRIRWDVMELKVTWS